MLALTESIITCSEQLIAMLQSEGETLDIEKLAELDAQRSKAIHQLFEQYPQEQLQANHELLIKIQLLDKQILTQMNAQKQILATEIIKLNQGKLKANIYQNTSNYSE